ncbi:hypothetical protein [Rhodococcus sp. X156]|uniref:hypothetical protein n=1 Tax=Rhodococcus sp. X156 TaxID=2499145 RepID=UPI000FDCAAD8|nr:hypothetical protein [Rhodococcus sp. X156]
MALTALRPAYTAVRLPLTLVQEQVIDRFVPAGAEPRATTSRLLGTADQLVGMVLQDESLIERGTRLKGDGEKPAPADKPAPTLQDAAAKAASATLPKDEPRPVPTAEPVKPAPQVRPAPVLDPDALTEKIEAENARADAAAALEAIDLVPAAPGDETSLVSEPAAPAAPAAPVDKATFAELQKEKADRQIAADEAARKARQS